MDEMRVSDIFNQFSDFESSSRMDLFLDKLQTYIDAKYTDTTTAPVEQFKKEYFEVIGVKSDSRESANKRVLRWFDRKVKAISRQEIIAIGFTLANGVKSEEITVDELAATVNNREHLVNDLLSVFSYPKLSAHNEVELFYIHGLRKGKSLQQTKQLYEQFLKMPPMDITASNLSDKNTSYFYEVAKALPEDDEKALIEIRKLSSAMILGSKTLRNKFVTDFEYELQIAQMNHVMKEDAETIFLMTSLQYSYLSSSLVKEIASYGGDISKFVPSELIDRIYAKYNRV